MVRVTESQQRPPGRRPKARSVCQRCGHYYARHERREPMRCLMCRCQHFSWREDGAEQLPLGDESTDPFVAVYRINRGG